LGGRDRRFFSMEIYGEEPAEHCHLAG